MLPPMVLTLHLILSSTAGYGRSMDAVTFEEARTAVAEVAPRFTTLLCGIATSSRAAVGDWSVADVASHVSHAIDLDTAANSGGRVPEVEPTPAGAAKWNASMLEADR